MDVEGKGAYRVWWESLRAKDHLEGPLHILDDNIKTYVQGVGWGMDWIDLAQGRERWGGGVCECGNEIPRSIK
jgi:hypothetical protein